MPATVESPPPAEKLITAEEFAGLPSDGRRLELVNGEVIEVPPPNFRHGVVCNRIGRRLGNYVEDRGLGWVLSNDSGVVTRRKPDTVRGADVLFYSYLTIPKDESPDGYAAVPPDLVFEVRSPSDRTRATKAKAREYLTAGVKVVCLVDPTTGTFEVHPAAGAVREVGRDENLTLPELFPDFSVPVRDFLD